MFEHVELYELRDRGYERVAIYGTRDRFSVPGFPDTRVDVARLFDTQMKRHERRAGKSGSSSDKEPEPIPRWLIAPETRLGLANLITLGHPKRRFEIWDNRAPCMLAFGSEEEARTRFAHFLEEICRSERAPGARPMT